MYYILSGPCKLCSAGCNGLSTLCKESCKCCGSVCEGFKSFWNDTIGYIYDQPIGGYVIFTWLSMLLTIAVAIYSYLEMNCTATPKRMLMATSTTAQNTDASNIENEQTALLVALVFAVVHCGCVFWIQRRILSSIKKTMDADYEQKGIPPEARDYDISDNYKGRVRAATCDVLKYDFVFCLYFFFVPCSFGVGCWGLSLLDKKQCETASYAALAFWILTLYNVCGGLYFCFMMCGIVCGAGKDKVKTQVKKVKEKGAAV